MARTPPKAVRRALAKEVLFGCPVPDCGVPFLEWHHFDPPYHVEEHHNPEGMIGLCPTHHAAADEGAFTKKQLREMKNSAKENKLLASAKFQWLRSEILLVAGGNFFLLADKIIKYRGYELLWLNRDANGNLCLNVNLISSKGQLTKVMIDNVWAASGSEADVECIPSGKSLKIKYNNGDALGLDFYNDQSAEKLSKKYGVDFPERWLSHFPLTVLEVNFSTHDGRITLKGNSLEFKSSEGEKLMKMKNCFMRDITGMYALVFD